MGELWMIWAALGFVAYCLIAGVCFVWFGKGGFGWHVPEMPAAIWPIILIVAGPVYLGRHLAEKFVERRSLQKELDEVRRKRDEQDAADAAKTEYR